MGQIYISEQDLYVSDLYIYINKGQIYKYKDFT